MFAQRIAPRIGPKVALVVSGSLRYGLARAFSTLTNLRSDLELRPFYELSEAEAWLREP